MDYLAQLNAFADYSTENLRPNEFCVYMNLLFVNNKLHWKEWFSITCDRLSVMTGISPRTISEILNGLRQKGYIEIMKYPGKRINKYRIIPLYGEVASGYPADKLPKTCRNVADKLPKTCRKPAAVIRQEETRIDKSKSNNTDLLTNSTYEDERKLTPAEERVRGAFECHFHLLTKLEDLDALKAYTGDYGDSMVVWAIERVSEKVQDSTKRQRLSPRYLLPVLQEESAKSAMQAKPVYDRSSPQGPDNRPPDVPLHWVWNGCGWEEPFVE